MNGRVLPLKGSEHSAIDALLPFYVNATLRGEELNRVKQHLDACDQCRREVDWLRKLFAACEATAPIPETPRDAELARIAAFAGPAAAASEQPQAAGWRSRGAEGWRATPPWARMLMAAQLAALAILATLHFTEPLDPAPYRTLGASARAAPGWDAIAVMFDPGITEGEMRRLLDSAGARIVDGPTASAAFLLEVPVGQSATAAQKLRADGKVRFAEPLGPRTER